MHVRIQRPGLGPIRSLPRGVAHRWPALAVATVAAALPMGVALANSGPTIFEGTASQPAITAINSFAAEAIRASGNVTIMHGGLSVSSPDHRPALQLTAHDQNQAIVATSESATAVQASTSGGLPAISATSNNGDGLLASGTAVGVRGVSNGPVNTGTGVHGFGDFTGVTGLSAHGAGVEGHSTSGPGVKASSTSGNAVVAEANKTAGTFAAGVQAIGDEAVVARSTTIGVDAAANGTAVAAVSNNEVGGFFGGKEAPIRLAAASSPGAPTTGTHHKGEFYVDSNGDLFYCKADSNSTAPAGVWKKLS